MKHYFSFSNTNRFLKYFKNLLVLIFTFSFQLPLSAQFVHPGLTNKRSDLDRVKYMVEAQIDPWYSSYQEMASDSKASLITQYAGDLLLLYWEGMMGQIIMHGIMIYEQLITMQLDGMLQEIPDMQKSV